jgi:hypothetical protein
LGEEEEVKTLQEMLTVHKTDIKTNHRLKLLKELTLYSLSLIIREEEYKKKIGNAKD